ncbi:MAG: DUF4349 domain-containing protein [Actinomycetota bacterium]|nr:DUF4349 domain-containing protein [Actinomycetota bacterium]
MSETLLNQIRATKPEAPSALRERVRALTVEEPARAPFLSRFRWRRLVLVVPATLVVAVAAAGVIGLTRDGVTGADDDTAVSAGATTEQSLEAYSTRDRGAVKGGSAPPANADSSAAVPPVAGQLQRYEAELRLRVDDVGALSDATKRAQRIALQHGGTVASLQYDAPAAGIGAAQITLRIPTTRVQSAMAELSQLGTIVGQRYGIEDLQQQADALQAQIEQAQRQIAQIQAQLRSSTLSDESRVVLQGRLANARQKLAGLREGLRGTNTEARTATVYLSLTTEEIEPAAVGGSRLDDIKDVLAWEGIALLYVLVVAGPFLILGLLVWLALRLRRRQVETRLLEQN